MRQQPTTQKERLTHLGYAYLGVGLAAQLLGALPALMRAAQARLEGCGCERGCPTCVHRPGCGDLNTSYSRFTLYSLLRALLLGTCSLLKLTTRILTTTHYILTTDSLTTYLLTTTFTGPAAATPTKVSTRRPHTSCCAGSCRASSRRRRRRRRRRCSSSSSSSHLAARRRHRRSAPPEAEPAASAAVVAAGGARKQRVGLGERAAAEHRIRLG